MQFKEGSGWKACYDEETGKYTAERKGPGYYHLYEITEEIFDALTDAAVEVFASQENNREQRRKKREEREKNDP